MKEYLFKKFELSIRWNSFESLAYQALFCLHQIALYHTCSSKLYGSIGVYFSILYLTVGLTNCGFSVTIAPFITYVSQSKTHFTQLLGWRILLQLLLIIGGAFIAGSCAAAVVPTDIISPYSAAVLTALLTFSEGIKRGARSLLQAAFNNKITSLIQIGSITSYGMLVWGYVTIAQTDCTFSSVVIPWIFVSYISTGLLLFFCMRWYQQLPTAAHNKDTLDHLKLRIKSAQWSNALLGLLGQLFSRNALVAVCTVQCGIEAIAPIKIITYILYAMLSMFRNIFQKPSAALLGWSREHTTNERSLFSHMLYTIMHHPVSYVLLLFGVCYYIGYVSLHTKQSISLFTVCILCMLCIIENIQALYESLFLHKERTTLLIGLYSVVVLLCAVLLLLVNSNSPLVFLTIILGARLVSCLAVALLSTYLWSVPLRKEKEKRAVEVN